MFEHYLSKIKTVAPYKPYQLGAHITNFDNQPSHIVKKKIALLGVESKDQQINDSNLIRSELFSLASLSELQNQIVDLGNIFEGETPADTNQAIKEISTELKKLNLVTIVIGTQLDQSEAIYNSYLQDSKPLELSLISSELPVLEYELLNRICTSQPNILSGLNALAFQAPLVAPKAIDTFENLNFGHYRLGSIKKNIEDAELYLRNSAITVFNINAIKHCEAPGKNNSQPNGLTSEESCQLARYSGLSDNTDFFGIFGHQLAMDQNNLTAKLIAQIIWYFLDGFTNRRQDSPDDHKEFVKYRCDLKENQPPIVFLKSKRTNRWWMQIDSLTIPCSYNDYQQAVEGELSQRSLNSLKKLH